MRGPFISCPICSVLIAGVDVDSEPLGYTREPWIRRGTHSQRVFFARPGGCSHGPSLPEMAETDEAFAAWDEWARAEADRRATEFKFTSRRRALFFYLLGFGTLNEVMQTPKDPPAAVKKAIEPFKPMIDLEYRKRAVPIGNAVPSVEAMQGVARQVKNPLS